MKYASAINNELNIRFLVNIYYLIYYIKIDFFIFLRIYYFLKIYINNSSLIMRYFNVL